MDEIEMPSSMWVTNEDIIDYAQDEAGDVADCLWKYRQLSPSCGGCKFKQFCDHIKEELDTLLEDEIQSSASKKMRRQE